MKITCTTAKVAATFPDGTPAVTVNKFGKGMCVVSAAARNNEEMPHNAAFKFGQKLQGKAIPEVDDFMQFLLNSAEFSKPPKMLTSTFAELASGKKSGGDYNCISR